MIRASLVAFLLVTCSGCYSHINVLHGYLPEEDTQRFASTNMLRKKILTSEAYAAVKDIPVVEGMSATGMAVGVSIWSRLAAFISGNGWFRKTIFNRDSLYKEGFQGIVHEDIHHLDDFDRRGEGEWIDHELFIQAYTMLSQDYKHKGIQRWCESRANDFIPNTFGVGENAEHIAYIGMYIAKNPDTSPDYLKAVFARILNITYKKYSIYKSMYGKTYAVIASPDKIEVQLIK